MEAKLIAMNNAWETVDQDEPIQGTRARSALVHKMAGITRNIFIWESAPRPGVWRRIPRQFFLTVRNDFAFNNPVYQAGLGLKYLWKKATGREVTRRPLSR